MTPGGPLTASLWPADTSVPLVELTVGDLLREAAADAPDRVALVAGAPDPEARRRWTYAELLADSERLAGGLLERFEPGDRVAIWAPNEPEWVLVEFAAALAGLVLVTVNPALRASEAEYVLRRSRADGVVFVESYRDNPVAVLVDRLAPELPGLRHRIGLDELRTLHAATPRPLPQVDPQDPAQIQFTSGTTGRPKGALLHHRGIVNNARFYVQRTELPTGSALLNPMPLFHTAGCVMATLGSVWLRGTHVLVPQFDPALVLELIEGERCASLGAVPTMLVALLEHPDRQRRDLSSLTVGVSGGSPVPAELVRRVEREIGCALTMVLGQTELAPVITQTRPGDTIEDKAGTVGQPLPQVDIAIADPRTGEPVSIGEQGEIRARGYQAMLGYFDDEEATAETIDAEGWVHTGDLGTMDARGYLQVTGRLKDMIIRGGENVYPREIEEVLFAHPAIGEAAVFGVPDERWGESVAAAVRLLPDDPPLTPAALEAWARERLAPHKVPRTWYVVPALPLTGSGKVQKYVLRDEAGTGRLPRLG
jgi:fatty-acyl-CoA synthase